MRLFHFNIFGKGMPLLITIQDVPYYNLVTNIAEKYT